MQIKIWDTLRSMRRAVFVVCVAASAACSTDPSLDVSVTHPTGLTVAKTTVTVYESESLRCTDVEFSRLDTAALEALAVTSTDINDAADGGLSGISRTGNKVIVARGYDARGTLISAGCSEKGEVVGHDGVAITTLIAALVSIYTTPDSIETSVSLTDALGASLADPRQVTWTAYGPAGTSAATPANVTAVSDGVWEPRLPSCASSGDVIVHPNPPSTLGGYAVQIRAAWAVEEPPAYTALSSTILDIVTFDSAKTISMTAKRYCAIKMKGTTHHLVCVFDTGTTPAEMNQVFEFSVAVTNGKPSVTQVDGPVAALASLPLGQTSVVALVSEPTGTGTDRDVYAITDRGVLVPLFGAAAVTTQTNLVTNATDALYVPSCGSSPAKILITSGALMTVKQIDALGGNPVDVMTEIMGAPTKITPDSAGCVARLSQTGTPQLIQIATLQTSFGTIAGDTLLFNCTASRACKRSRGVTLTRGAGVGFTGGSEPRLVTTTVDATGVVLVEVVFSPSNAPVERARLPAASIPGRIIAAQADGDTGTDLIWDLASRTGSTSLEIAYARQVGADNLEALSGSVVLTISDLAVGDLDGDNFDDIVVTAREGIAIVPNNAALAAPAANTDVTCMP